MTKSVMQHKLEGTHRKDRHGDVPKRLNMLNEQKRVPVLPPDRKEDLFEYLTAHLMRLGISDEVDAMSIQILANQWSDYCELRQYIDDNGVEVTVGNKLAVNVANDMAMAMQKVMRELFLTPQTREKARIEEKEIEADPVADFLDLK